MNLKKRLFLKLSIFVTVALAPVGLFSQSNSPVAVYIFSINGPNNTQYLATAAQDAVVGSLVQKGQNAQAIKKNVDPDKLSASQLERGKYSLALTGRINIVGQTYRVLVKWIDVNGREGQQYLEASDINQLLPQIEYFAKNSLPVTPVAVAAAPLPPSAPAPVKPAKQKAEIVQPVQVEASPVTAAQAPIKVAKQAAPVVVAPPPSPVVQAQPPPVTKKTKAPKGEVTKVTEVPAGTTSIIHDYVSRSQALRLEVRSMAYGDVDRDGTSEVVLTAKEELHVYHLVSGQLQEIYSLVGKPLDNFVKVDILPATDGGNPYIVLTNLRGSSAASKILRVEGGQIKPIVENIPYQLRVVSKGPTEKQLLGENYHAEVSTRHQIYEMKMIGNRVDVGPKLDLPYEISLYSFDWLTSPTSAGLDMIALTQSGKVYFYKSENGKFKKVWSSRETYGGSPNAVAVNVKDFFNEVTASFYVVPVGIASIDSSTTPDLVVAKNDALLKDIVGRSPLISDGRLIRLKWDQLGFVEAWESKKVDGSIADYTVISTEGQLQLVAAVRLRDPGLLGDVGKKDSVLLVYNLN